jgi:hypothetical protein
MRWHAFAQHLIVYSFLFFLLFVFFICVCVTHVAPDVERFPRVMEAEAYEVHLNAGDSLYIPPLWGHYVVSRSEGAGVNVWSRDDVATMDGM